MTGAVLKTPPPRTLGAWLLAALLAGCAAPPATGPDTQEPAKAQGGAPAVRPAAPPPPAARIPRSTAPVTPPPAPGAAQEEPAPEGDEGVLLGRGLASWYGGRFHGRRTASGERFDRGDLTAAHRTLPFGARVCVRSMVNGKVVVVRVNDRGPFAPGRVIDLSQAAAEELGMTGLGIKPVEIWRMGEEDDTCPDGLPELDDAGDAPAQAQAPAPRLPAARKGRAARPAKAPVKARRR